MLMEPDRKISLFAFDHDGVLTDGSILTDDRGIETKTYHVRDGLGLVSARRMGLITAVITGRATRGVRARVRELQIPWLFQGVRDKGQTLTDLCTRLDIPLEQTAFMGDDVIDLPAMRIAGIAISVADADPTVRQAADFVTQSPGGRGAIREALQWLLSFDNQWETYMNKRFGC